MKITSSCLTRQAASKYVLLTLKGRLQNMTTDHVRSGQGHVMTPVCQYAYFPKRLDEASRLAPFGVSISDSPSCRKLLAKNGL